MPQNAHVTLFINIVHKSLLNALLKTDKPDAWGATIVSKDKA